MLQLFQNEWDSQMLETFNLKQQLDAVSNQCRIRTRALVGSLIESCSCLMHDVWWSM
jgi:hypothetical protein